MNRAMSHRRTEFAVLQGEDGTVEVVVSLPPVPEAGLTPPDTSASPAWSWLSPLTVRVVRLLCGTGWIPREEIAHRLGEQPDGKLAWMLTDLAERNVLESSPRKGYHLAIPENAEAEAFRSKLLLWLEGQGQ